MPVTTTEIYALAERIGEQFRPERLILFGSHAYGAPTPESDVDLLVVMEHEGSSVAQAVEIVRRVKSRFPIDLVVRSPKQLRQRLAWNDYSLKEVMGRGKVLYESVHPEWIQKAEGDFATAGRELRARKDPNYDAACFHANRASIVAAC